jgi:predicted fused transcriptional regulator/phosphomethylpyrimidine kinase
MDPARERNNLLSTLQAAVAQLEPSMNIRLIPPEGISFGYALHGARERNGVAAVKGGIKSDEGGQLITGPCVFGADEPVVRIILTAIKFDPEIRSAAVLQFSDRALGVFENDLFLERATLDVSSGNPGISTMDWGIASCCKKGIPDIIIRKCTGAAASYIILFGEGPADVANNIIICSNRI